MLTLIGFGCKNNSMVDNFEPYEVTKGRELQVRDENGNIYAGEWALDQTNQDNGMITIGTYEDDVRGPCQPVRLKTDKLKNQTIATGERNTGKKNMVTNTEIQLLRQGHGVVHITEEGDCEDLIESLPEDLYEDCIYVDAYKNEHKSVGFNILQIPKEVEQKRREDVALSTTEDLVTILKDYSGNWGPQIGNISETLINQLVMSEDPLKLTDAITTLYDDEEAELFGEKYGDGVQDVFIDRIVDADATELDPILRRMRAWVENRSVRTIVSNAESDFSLYKALNNGNLVIFDLSDVRERSPLPSLLTTRVKTVSSVMRGGEKPFVFFDGFSDHYGITSKLVSEMGDCGVFISFGKLDEYDKDVRSRLKDSEVKISFNSGNDDSESSRVALMYNTSADRILSLNDDECVSHTMTEDGFVSENPVDTSVFYAYPSVRDGGLRELREDTKERFGADLDPSPDIEDFGVSRFE